MSKFLSALPIVVLFLCLLVPSALYRQWWLFSVFMVFGLIFGAIEVISIKVSGLSVSQHFWELKSKDPRGALTIIIGMIVAWASLLYHFWFQGKKK